MTRTLLVLGGGIVGLSCAYEAVKFGWRVTVVDRGEPGGQASGAAAGLLAPYYENGETPDEFFRLCLDSLGRYPAWTDEIEEDAGIGTGFVRSGSLQVALHEADRLPLEGRMAWQSAFGAQMEWLDGAALARAEPALAPGLAGALYCRDEAQVQAPLLVKALLRACAKRGVQLLPHAGELLGLERIAAGGVSARFAECGRLDADAVCCCLGAWSGQLAASLGLRIPVHPIRGQICAYEPSPVALRQIVFGPQAYWVLKPDGSLICGASEDEAGFDRSVTEPGIGRLLRASGRMIPALAKQQATRGWAGLRPATLDGRPLIGPVPETGDIFVAAGHYRNGILLSPATAAAFAAWLETGGRSRQTGGRDAFRPERFGCAANGAGAGP